MQPCRSVHTRSRPWSGSRSTRAIELDATTIAGGFVVVARAMSAMLAAMRRARAIVSGRVQGVSYPRVDRVDEARRLGVVGWVRNRADGSVELEAEGPDERVAALLAWCEHGPPAARVARRRGRGAGADGPGRRVRGGALRPCPRPSRSRGAASDGPCEVDPRPSRSRGAASDGPCEVDPRPSRSRGAASDGPCEVDEIDEIDEVDHDHRGRGAGDRARGGAGLAPSLGARGGGARGARAGDRRRRRGGGRRAGGGGGAVAAADRDRRHHGDDGVRRRARRVRAARGVDRAAHARAGAARVPVRVRARRR